MVGSNGSCAAQPRILKRVLSFKREKSSNRSFAHDLGINPQCILNWQRGGVPDDATLVKMAERLGTTYLYLKCGMGPRDGKEADRFWRAKTAEIWSDDPASGDNGQERVNDN